CSLVGSEMCIRDRRNPDFALLGRAYGCAVRQPQDLDELERDLRAGFGQPGVTLIELRHACAR
ncbi:hypothetical protein KZ855_18145, partial [Pseudomonas aeruginosa]|nr:hypothetical protein [Pseudomonas aeruginosa]